MSYSTPTTAGYSTPTGGEEAAGESAGGLSTWTELGDTDFGALHTGTIGAFLASLTYDSGTNRWTATWVGSHPGNAPGLRQSQRMLVDLGAALPDFVQDGNWGVTIRVTIHSLSNTGTRLALFAGVADRDGTDNGSGLGLGAVADDLNGTQTQLTGCNAATKTGGSTNYTGTPEEMTFTWLPCQDPTVGNGGTAKADFFDGTSCVHTAEPADTGNTWTGNLVLWMGFGGQAVGSGGSAVFSVEAYPFRWRLDTP